MSRFHENEELSSFCEAKAGQISGMIKETTNRTQRMCLVSRHEIRANNIGSDVIIDVIVESANNYTSGPFRASFCGGIIVIEELLFSLCNLVYGHRNGSAR